MPSLETAVRPNAYALTDRTAPDGHVAIVLDLFRDTLRVGSRTVAVVGADDVLMAKFEWHHTVAKLGLMRLDDDAIGIAEPSITPDQPVGTATAPILKAA